MTAIVAHRSGWMVSDRRQTFNGSLIGPYRTDKIKRGEGILVACAGNGVFIDLVGEVLDAAPASGQLRAVVELFREKGKTLEAVALAVTAEGIAEITSDGALLWLTSEWWAIGSGFELVLGYLQGASQTRPVTPEMAAEAIAFASTRVNNVGDGIQTERL